MKKPLITYKRSVIVALDIPDADACGQLAWAVKGVAKIGGFKFGFVPGLRGLDRAVAKVQHGFGRDTAIIYDPQKGATDIPEMGKKFAREMKHAGCHAVILFPLAGPETQTQWTKACQDVGLRVLIGGMMTHPQFLASEGGYISDDAPERIFRLACNQGVTDFVVPGNKVKWVEKLRGILVEELGEGNFVLYAPGFIKQGGDISECGKAAGANFHAIVGSAIYERTTSKDMCIAAMQSTSKL